MQRATLATDLVLFGVLPILPAAGSILAVIAASFGGLILAIVSLRLSSVRYLSRVVWRQKWGLVTLTLSVVIIIQAIGFNVPRQASTKFSSFANGSWPQFRGSPLHSGHADSLAGPIQGGVLWSAGRGFEFHSSPAIVGDTVIAVGCQGDTARFFCCRATTGEPVWSVAPAGYRATFSSPVVDRGLLLCGEGLHQTTGSRLMCFDLNTGSDQQITDRFNTRSHIECTPLIENGRVYFGAGDDGIYCLELPKRPGEGLREVWHVPGDKYPDAETALAVHQGRVYMGLGIGGEALCVLDAGTGRELQRVKLPQPVFSPPVIQDNRIYVGLGRADYVNYRTSPPGEVRCLDLETLNTIWTIPTESAVLAAIVATPEAIYFSTVNGQLHAVTPDGQITHSWSAPAPMLSAPAVTNRMVYCVGCDGMLTGLNRQLERAWSVRLGSPGDYISSPVVFQGHLYVGTPEEGLLCVGEPLHQPEPDVTFASSDNIQPPVSSIPSSAEFEWGFDQPVPGEVAEVTASPVASEEGLYVPIANKGWMGIARADFGPVGPPQTRWFRKFPHQIRVAPTLRGGQVICLSGESAQPGQLAGLDHESGTINWRCPIENTPDSVLVDADSVYVQSTSSRLTRCNLKGELLWQVDVGQINHAAEVQGAIVVLATSAPDRLMALDSGTGRVLWKVELPVRTLGAPVIHGAQVYVSTAQSLEKRSLINGSLETRLNVWRGIRALTVDSQQMLGITMNGEVQVGSADGVIRHRWTAANAAITPLRGHGSVLFADNSGRLMRGSLDGSGQAQLWYAPGDKGRISHAPVVLNERVYVPIAERGLVCLKAGSLP